MVVIGIDPGTAITGYGLVREAGGKLAVVAYGVIRTPPERPMTERLVGLYRELKQLVTLHGPDAGAVERLFFQKNVATAMSVGQARGVALLALADAGISVGEYTPRDVKQAVTGYGSAAKAQVQQMVRALLNLPQIPRPDDAADALAVAICHLHSLRINTLRD